MSVIVQEATADSSDGSDFEVYLRFRPMNKLEISRRSRSCVQFHSTDGDGIASLTVDSPLEGEYDFSFDKIFKEDANQEEVFNSISSQAKRLVDGYNAAIIAFGQSGSGKTNTMMGDNPLQKNDRDYRQPDIKQKSEELPENTGMIPRLAKEIFELMGKASPTIEFTVRVSFVEIYLEQIRDLLNPSKRFLKVDDGEEKSDYERRKGPKLGGLSEVCCLEWSEVVALLFRGNSYRVVSEQRKQTDMNQSHSIFTIQIEQRNLVTERTISSKMHLVDLAGNEIERQIQRAKSSRGQSKSQVRERERSIINRSHLALSNVLKNLARQQHQNSNFENNNGSLPPTYGDIPYHESKLTRILCNALGGNCFTTFLLTASTATFNVSSTVATLRFGERCKQIQNYPYLNIEASPEECNIELEKSKKIQSELLLLIKAIGTEMKRMKDKGTINTLQDEGPLWDKLNQICENNKYFVLEDESVQEQSNSLGMSLQDELQQKEDEIKELKVKLAETRTARDKAQTLMLEMGGECAFLRNESEEVLAAKKRNTEDIIDAQNDIQKLSQKKLELEHDLRTSHFRETEAVTFLRMFRRFYRKLSQNNSAHGTGTPGEIMLKMAGVPNLDDLIDIDVLLCESGLIEDYEVNSNMDNKGKNPSVNAIVRSSALASKAKRQAKLQLSGPRQGTVATTSTDITSLTMGSTTSDTFDDSSKNVIIIPTISKSNSGISAEQIRVPKTPAVALTEKRIDGLERDLINITRRCIDLQIALNESEEWVELLTMSKTKKKVMEENFDLKNQLAKKESDLKSLIWKMNEIHIINSTYNEKLSSKEQHISYLEEKLTRLHHKDILQTSKQEETERKLRTEVMRLNTIIDAMSKVHWQDGKKGHKERLESRIVIPFQGGSSLEPNIREQMLQGPPGTVGRLRSSGNKTVTSESDGRTTTDVSYALSFGPSIASSVYVDKSQMALNNSLSRSEKYDDISLATRSLATSVRPSSKQLDSSVADPLDPLDEHQVKPIPKAVLSGGKTSNFEPRRGTEKMGSKIMPAIFKKSSTPSSISSQADRQMMLTSARKKIDDLDRLIDKVSF